MSAPLNRGSRQFDDEGREPVSFESVLNNAPCVRAARGRGGQGRATMTNPDIMRARAKRLYDEAQKIDDPGRRLAQILRAVEFEAEAEALRVSTAPLPSHS